MFGDLGANSPDCRREKESRPGESQNMLPRATGTERRRDPAGAQIVERLLAGDPDAFVAAPTAVHGR